MSTILRGSDNFESDDVQQLETYVNNKPTGFKNLIINGGFDVWQRGESIQVPAGQILYTADRWIIINNTNQALTVEKAYMSAFGLEGIPRIRMSFTVAPTTGDVKLAQRIENIHGLATKRVTTQFLHSSLENLTISAYHLQNFGTGGSSAVSTSLPTAVSTGSLNVSKYINTATLPSVLGKTVGAGFFTDLTIILPIRTTNPFSIAQVQLEEGSVATPFEQRPYGLELSLCQRYYEIGYVKAWGSASAGGQAMGHTQSYKIYKRVIPTISFYNTTLTNVTPLVAEYSIDCLVSYANSVSSGIYVYQSNFSASAEL